MGLSGGRAALATAVSYPLGVLGVIFAILLLRKLFVKPADLETRKHTDNDHTYVGQFIIINPAIEGKTIGQVSQQSHLKFIVSRVWRGEEVIMPLANTVLHTNDNVLVVANREDIPAVEILFGEKVKKDWNKEKIDWNHIDAKVESRVIVLTQTVLNGKRLGQLHLRDTYGVNVSRVIRGDIKLLATDGLRLQYGDRVTVVGEPKAVDHVEKFLGNAVQTLNEPNLGSIFLGMMLGLALGTIPFSLPGKITFSQ